MPYFDVEKLILYVPVGEVGGFQMFLPTIMNLGKKKEKLVKGIMLR